MVSLAILINTAKGRESMQITATELKNRLGRYLDAAEQEPVRIQKSGREKAVLMSYSHYQQLVKSQQPETKPVEQLM